MDVNLQARIEDVPFAVLDVETTGLDPGQGHRVIDISLIKWQGGEIVDTYGTLVNPRRQIPKEATDVHGITTSDLVGSPTFPEIAGHVWAFLDGATIVAHNAEFDVRFINYELAQAGYEQWSGIMLCTLKMVRKMQGKKNNKLGDVAMRMGVVAEKQHSAAGDTFITLGVFQKLLGGLQATMLYQLLSAQGGLLTPPRAPLKRKHDIF